MTDIQSILDKACTKAQVETRSRKRLLEYISDLLAEQHPDLSARSLFDELMSRERLGSTGLGDGVAIPHCRIPCEQIMGACITLQNPVDYDSIDGEPVDLLFALIVPPDETTAHLEVLAALARMFAEPANRSGLRAIASDELLFERVTGMFND